MRFWHRLPCLIGFWIFLLLAYAQERLFYTVTIPNPALKRFHVIVRVQNSSAPSLQFTIPAWCPGYYVLLNYEQDIENVVATDSQGNLLKVTLIGKRTWRVSNPDPVETVLEYDVNCRDTGYGFFRCYMDENNAFINGPACFMYLEGHKEKPVTLTVHIPPNWQIATGLQRTDKPNVFTAANYDELIDCPLELGKFQRSTFQVQDTEFEVVITGTPKAKVEKWLNELRKVSEAAIRLMKGAPFKRYVYLIHLVPAGGMASFMGGLEHLYSTVLSVHAGSESLAGLAAHELFHAWNVKRIRPAVLGPFDYTQPVRTNHLWFAEGVTEYYAHLIVVRAGLDTPQSLLRRMENEINQLQRTPARHKVSLAQSSYKVWEANNSSGYGGVNYYTKGCVVGFLMDIQLRVMTQNRKSLDDLMHLLMERYGLPKPGYPEDGIVQAYSELAGREMSRFYQRLVESTEELPYEEVLQGAGLQLVKENGHYRLKPLPNPTPEQKQVLEGWLHGTPHAN